MLDNERLWRFIIKLSDKSWVYRSWTDVFGLRGQCDTHRQVGWLVSSQVHLILPCIQRSTERVSKSSNVASVKYWSGRTRTWHRQLSNQLPIGSWIGNLDISIDMSTNTHMRTCNTRRKGGWEQPRVSQPCLPLSWHGRSSSEFSWFLEPSFHCSETTFYICVKIVFFHRLFFVFSPYLLALTMNFWGKEISTLSETLLLMTKHYPNRVFQSLW